ncbi:hypothetical protein ENSA5_59930 [Enhygromyxa salina]|uniref:Uncharacterized protein n=1 Tax=Enhygromyxa salina TaxID=215803 RepID=A0A2S9XDH2_9BACT|nr:hypothetical protein [Enhygromyxa salina]PRP90918.1 hypothetical protein ENSA5_59930 [Enhygromyxa salina]
MRDSASAVAGAVGELRVDVEHQQQLRTELARSTASRIARVEAEIAAQAAGRQADRPNELQYLRVAFLNLARKTEEDADPRFVSTMADEVERREIEAGYLGHIDELESLRVLLQRLAEGSRRAEVELYLRVGAEAAAAAGASWTASSGD